MNTPPNTPTSTQPGTSTLPEPSARPVRPIKPMRRPSSFRTPVASPANPVNPFSAPEDSAKNPRNPFITPLKRFNPPFGMRVSQPDPTPRDRELRRRERKLSFRAQKKWTTPTPTAQAGPAQNVSAFQTPFPPIPTITAFHNSIPFRPTPAVLTTTTTTPTSTYPPALLPGAVPTLPTYTVTLPAQTIIPTGGLVRRPTESSINSDSTHTKASSFSPGQLSPEEYEHAFDEICEATQGYFDLPTCPAGPSQVALGKRRASGQSQVALGQRRESFLGRVRPAPPRRRSTAGARPKPRLGRAPIRSRRQTEPGPVIVNTEQLDPFVINVDIHYQMLMKELAEHSRLENQIIHTMDSLNNMTIAALDMTRENSRKLEAMKVRLDAQRRGQGSSGGMDNETLEEMRSHGYAPGGQIGADLGGFR